MVKRTMRILAEMVRDVANLDCAGHVYVGNFRKFQI